MEYKNIQQDSQFLEALCVEHDLGRESVEEREYETKMRKELSLKKKLFPWLVKCGSDTSGLLYVALFYQSDEILGKPRYLNLLWTNSPHTLVSSRYTLIQLIPNPKFIFENNFSRYHPKTFKEGERCEKTLSF